MLCNLFHEDHDLQLKKKQNKKKKKKERRKVRIKQENVLGLPMWINL